MHDEQVVSNSLLLDKLAKAIGDFGAQLGSSKVGTLTQVRSGVYTLLSTTLWLPCSPLEPTFVGACRHGSPRPVKTGGCSLIPRCVSDVFLWHASKCGARCTPVTSAHRPLADPIPQGLPFCINGAGDLLALFRCISCKYKFSTDATKPGLMGPGMLRARSLALLPSPSASRRQRCRQRLDN